MIRSTTFVVAVLLLVGAGSAQAAYWQADDLLPSPLYTEKEEEVILYANNVMARNAQFGTMTGRMSMPGGGGYNVDSFFDIFVEVSIDGGGTWITLPASGMGTMLFNALPPAGGVTEYDTEMIALSLVTGDPLPGAMIRESPTRASTGGSRLEDLGGGGGGGGGYHIDSFFDVFTELSVDGGASWAPVMAKSLDGGLNWMPGEQPIRLDGSPEPATLSLLALGGLAALLRRRRA